MLRNKSLIISMKIAFLLYSFLVGNGVVVKHISRSAASCLNGGEYWSKEQKRTFANDFENLIAVEDNANQSKGATPPQKWMPHNKLFHCMHLNKWKSIKLKYRLNETISEKSNIKEALKANSCK